MFERIMVAYDGSDCADRALAAGVKLLDCYNADLAVVMVAGLPDYAGTISEVDEIQSEARAFFDQKITKVEELAGDQMERVSTHLLFGHTGDQLIRFARERNMDLVVIGARGFSRLQRMFLGSVSQFVVKHAYCPVLVIKDPCQAEHPSPHDSAKATAQYW